MVYKSVYSLFISKDIKNKEFKLTDLQEKMLRRISRKTWAYFEDFVNEKDNWLAPDNYQEESSKWGCTKDISN
jgi:hypothetical protein